jgi:hypothetical protein
MPRIPNYPEALTKEHSDWHMSRSIPEGEHGSGFDFLTFHHRFLEDFHKWYDKQPFADQAATAPWVGIPPELKVQAFGWNADLAASEDRIVHHPETFANVDQLGIVIETVIHDWLHPNSAVLYNEPVLSTAHGANVSTHFYQIHGLVDSWFTSWLQSDAAAKVDAWFDRDGYLAAYPDARAAAAKGVDPLEHYRQVGWREGHNPSAAFNTDFYLKAHPDVAAAGINPLDNFLHFGHADGQLSFSDGHWMI